MTNRHYETVRRIRSALDGHKPKEATIQAVGSKLTIESDKAPNEEKTRDEKKKKDYVIGKMQRGRIFLPHEIHISFRSLNVLCMLPKGTERLIYKLTQQVRENQKPNPIQEQQK